MLKAYRRIGAFAAVSGTVHWSLRSCATSARGSSQVHLSSEGDDGAPHVGIAEWKSSLRRVIEQRHVFHRLRDMQAFGLATLTAPSPQGEALPRPADVGNENSAVDQIGKVARNASCAADVVRGVAVIFHEVERTAQRSHTSDDRASTLSAAVHALLGALRFVDGAKVGDLPLHYIGHAVKEGIMNDELWSDAMLALALLQVSPKMFDLWAGLCLESYGIAGGVAASAPQPIGDQALSASSLAPAANENDEWEVVDGPSSSRVASSDEDQEEDTLLRRELPFDVVHAMLSWASQAADVERALTILHKAKAHGIGPSASDTPGATAHSQLKLLVKVIATVRHTTLDGGVKALMLREIKATVPRSVVLETASWGVLQDLIAGLTFDAALLLVKQAANARGGDEHVPFFVWASLLRKAAKRHYVSEAEHLFLFVRKRFALTSEEKGELVEVMMRMYCGGRVPDFASVMSLFLDHVVHHPDGEAGLQANATHYKLLVKAADSRNAAAMVFLEGCADGVPHDAEVFGSLFERNPQSSVASLSRKLPRDYSSSPLDAQLKIPGNVDAHLRREEALRLRGKPLVDSTTEVR